MVETTNPTIDRAIEVVETERERTTAEADAFRTFLSRLQAVDPPENCGEAAERAVPTGRPIAITRVTAGTSTRRTATDRIGEAYRETVMGVDHYEEEYGHSLATELACEFGERAARAVVGDEPLTAVTKEYLRSRTRRSLSQRRGLSRELDAELDSLTAADDELGDVESTLFECQPATPDSVRETKTTITELRELERRCREVVDARQRDLHSRSNARLRGVDGLSLNRYLYEQRLQVTCPVLHDAMTIFETVRSRRRRCESRSPRSNCPTES